MPQIVLVRHGRSAYIHRGGWLDAAGLHRWYAAYDQAGIDPAAVPPLSLLAWADDVGVVASSDAPRALASAERIVLGARPVIVSPLLRETEFRPPGWAGWRMPLGAWVLAIGVEWLRERVAAARVPAEDRARAVAASGWLTGLAAEHGSVLAVTHAGVRRLITSALTSEGWALEDRRHGHRPWSSWHFTRARS